MLNSFGRLRANRDFLAALTGRSVSVFGDEMALVALTLRLQASGARPYAVALLLGAGLVPFVVLARAAGRVADSADSRRVLLAASVAQACCCAPLIVVRDPAVMIALVAALGAGAAFSQATWQALTPRVAGEDNIAVAMAAQQTCFTLASVLAPAASGVLSGAFGTGAPLAIDAVSFGAMVAAAATVRARRSPAPADHSERIRGGWSLLRADRLLRPLVTGLAAFVLLAMMLNVVGVFLIRGTLRASATWYGVIEAAWMLGVVTGTLSAGALSAGMLAADGRRALAALGGAGLMSLAFVGYGLAPAVILLAPLAVLGGAGNGLANVCVSTLVMSRTPERARGRVSAALGAVLNGAMVTSLAAGGGLAALLAPRAIFLLAGGLGCLAVLLVAAGVAVDDGWAS